MMFTNHLKCVFLILSGWLLIAYAAFSGDFLELGFDLPFIDFLPPTVDLNFRIKVLKQLFNALKRLICVIYFFRGSHWK